MSDFEKSFVRLREELDAWEEQQPFVRTGPDPYYGEPRVGNWWHLNVVLEAVESGVLDPVLGIVALRQLIVEKYDYAPPWSICARRNMIVAAFNGTVWLYGEPRPKLMVLGLVAADSTPSEQVSPVRAVAGGRNG